MNADELRALVRESVERHLGRLQPGGILGPQLRAHPSHERFTVPSGGEGDGPCLIEPTVHCNHCGYCQSFGH